MNIGWERAKDGSEWEWKEGIKRMHCEIDNRMSEGKSSQTW